MDTGGHDMINDASGESSGSGLEVPQSDAADLAWIAANRDCTIAEALTLSVSTRKRLDQAQARNAKIVNDQGAEVEPRADKGGRSVRLSVNLSPEAQSALRSIAERRDASITNAIRLCISTQMFVDRVKAKGGKILINERSGSVHEFVVLE
jgi:hypothetical protein